MNRSLTLVIPCLNEEEAAPSVLEKVSEVRNHFLNDLQFKEVQVIVVDDASQDRSVEIIRSFPFVELVQHSETKGYGASLRAGFEKSRGNWICFLDMDHSYPPAQIAPLWQTLVSHDLDIVHGQRSFASEGMSFTRGFGNWLFSSLSKLFLKTEIQDVCSGFRLFRKECLPEILSISESTLGYSLEMSIRSVSAQWRIREVQIDYLPRKGASKLSVWKDGWIFLSLILSASLRQKRKKEARL